MNLERKQRPVEDDDGHVIAPMNVEGMPWYPPKVEKRTLPPKYETKKLPPKEVVNRLKPIFPPGVEPFAIPNF